MKLTSLSRAGVNAAVGLLVIAGASVAVAQHKQHHHYKLIDLGGGPVSGIATPNTGPLNDLGMMLGGTETANADPFAPNYCFTNCFVARSVLWFDGHEIELSPLPGAGEDLSSLASSINAFGWSIGQAQNGEVDPATSWPETRAVLWRGDSITDLGSLGGTQGIANGINDFGQVVGGSATNIPDVFYNDSLSACLAYPVCGGTFSFDALFFPVTTEVHAFLWQGGHMRDLGTLSGPDGNGTDSTALMINNHGEVTGWSFTANATTVEPFFWSPKDGKMISMGSLGGTYGNPFWLNNKGQVTGASNLLGDQTEHPFIWSKATGMHDLFLDCTWCGTFGHPDAMNDAGQVVGYAQVAGDPSDRFGPIAHGFLWSNGVMTDLGPPLAGDTSYEAGSINRKGQIVGGSDYDDVYGFLWENGGPIVNLNELVVPRSALTVVQAAFINDRGEIACVGHTANGDSHPCLLIPCDDDHSGVEGCDYSMAEASATVARENARPAPAMQLHPETKPPSVHQMLRRRMSQSTAVKRENTTDADLSSGSSCASANVTTENLLDNTKPFEAPAQSPYHLIDSASVFTGPGRCAEGNGKLTGLCVLNTQGGPTDCYVHPSTACPRGETAKSPGVMECCGILGCAQHKVDVARACP